jgi:hypothetical protein
VCAQVHAQQVGHKQRKRATPDDRASHARMGHEYTMARHARVTTITGAPVHVQMTRMCRARQHTTAHHSTTMQSSAQHAEPGPTEYTTRASTMAILSGHRVPVRRHLLAPSSLARASRVRKIGAFSANMLRDSRLRSRSRATLALASGTADRDRTLESTTSHPILVLALALTVHITLILIGCVLGVGTICCTA